MCKAVDRFRRLNPELFDDARAGAMLLRMASDAREAIDKVADHWFYEKTRCIHTAGFIAYDF